MEYIEILFSNVKNQFVDEIIKKELKIASPVVKSSHFHNKNENKDLEYSDNLILKDYFAESNTGNMFVSRLTIGELLNDVMIVMSFDKDSGDIVLNFSENELNFKEIDTLKYKVENMAARLAEIGDKYEISSIKLGYESVLDAENVILSISNSKYTVVNKFAGQLSLAIEHAFL